MANAKLIPPTAPPEVQLTLTKYEAETLLAVCGWIGGDPAGRRGAMDRIATALERVRHDGKRFVGTPAIRIAGDLYFGDRES